MSRGRYIWKIADILKGIRPPIWRIFLVDNQVTFAELHEIIQIIMGWKMLSFEHR
ncbi:MULTISPECIES: IS1096 element passenger TnpR family protein [Bacillus]|uniref:IS1096 element passenger TnpR family protein n=1 Tax=Bacillus TaxID=1386 RepID=UPI00031583FB|nr:MULTISPECIES: hypothetical protein [Bacillus]MBO1581577.1 hypothetical protein [Bacillus sp. XF8]MBY0597770.1 plasmid pRiA4b ORF-3 family protein [Bacillus bingmayongensis]